MSGSASAEAARTEIENFVAGLSAAELDYWLDHWLTQAHAAQLPPEGDWTIWLMIGGRGAGKTRAGAEYVRGLALGEAWAAGEGGPVTPVALISETQAQARSVMVEGVSGILAVCGDDAPAFDRGRGELRWANGSVARIFGASEPDALRGHQFAAAWCDELAKWPKAEETWDQLQFCLRLGARPRQLVTTTPRPIALLKRLRGEAGVAETHIRTEENAANLAPDFLKRIVARYAGTTLGRQELDGEFIEDAADALWRRAALEAGRLIAPPQMQRIVVAVDPPVTSHKHSDACGIVVAGRTGEGAVVLDDLTLQPAPPLDWAERAVAAFHRWSADAIVAEVNQGGELVAQMIAQVDRAVPVKQVRARRGKWLRAEPVAALYARGLVRHAGFFPELEDEMCAFGRDGIAGGSPDRVDALVWAITELMLTREAGEPRFYQF